LEETLVGALFRVVDAQLLNKYVAFDVADLLDLACLLQNVADPLCVVHTWPRCAADGHAEPEQDLGNKDVDRDTVFEFAKREVSNVLLLGDEDLVDLEDVRTRPFVSMVSE